MARTPDPAEILARDREAADRFAERAGRPGLRKALERAQADLKHRLEHAEGLAGPGVDSFTATQVRATLGQVQAVLGPLTASIRVQTMNNGREAAEQGAQATIDYMRAAERSFTGVGSSHLPIDEAALYERAIVGTESSILARIANDPTHPGHRGVIARYGSAVIAHFERDLQQRQLARRPWDDVRADLVASSPFLQGAPAHWAERILRTESMAASGRAAFESIRAAADSTLPDMCKVLVCGMDGRTGADSISVHGQIRRPNEDFESWNGSFPHPPDRPNDRAVVVPQRISWPIPAYLQPKPWAMVASRWKEEGHKAAMPGRPLMSTIDLALFGVRQAPAVAPVQVPAPVTPPLREEPVLPPPRPQDVPSEKSPGLTNEPANEVVDLAAHTFRRRSGEEFTAKGFAATQLDRLLNVPGRFADITEFAKPDPEAAAALRRELAGVKNLKKAIETRAELARISPADWQHVLPPAYAPSLEKTAAHVAGINSGDHTNRNTLPVLLKSGGRVFLHDGAELVAANRLVSSGTHVRVLDLDALKPSVPLDASRVQELAKRLAAPVKKAAANKATPEEQAQIRAGLREVLKSHGIISRDDRRGGAAPGVLTVNAAGRVSSNEGLGFSPVPNPEMDVLTHAPRAKMRDALAKHGWGGRVTLRNDLMKVAAKPFQALEKNPRAFATPSGGFPESTAAGIVQEKLLPLEILIHEELHGASYGLPSSYSMTDGGVAIEEAATEILARKITRELAGIEGVEGKTVPFGLPTYYPESDTWHRVGPGAGYDGFIEDLFGVTAQALGTNEGIHAKVEAALLKTRSWNGAGDVSKQGVGDAVWRKGPEQIEAYADALGLKGAAKQELVKQFADRNFGRGQKLKRQKFVELRGLERLAKPPTA